MATLPSEGLKQLAKRTGLSVSTVSRVLNGKAAVARISEATRERVLKEAAQAGIVINAVARGLRLQKTLTLGLIIPDISNPFFAALARQVERASRANGYSVLLCDSEESTEVEAENVRLMQGRRVDGLVVAPVGGRQDHLAAVRAAGMPLVLIDRVFHDLNVPTIAADNAAGAALAVEHLHAAGHLYIGCVQGLPASSTNAARVKGFKQAMKKRKLDVRAEWITGRDYTLECAHGEALKLLSARPRPTAIVALGNVIALGVLHAARDLGLRVPQQLSLVSFDDQPWAEWISPPLTTIAQPVEELGAKAMDLFFEQLETKEGDEKAETPRVTLPMKLIERQSVAKLSTRERASRA